jgi:hypothetical protein
MTGPELAAIRRALCGTNTATFGTVLGLGGNSVTVAQQVRRLETRDKIPEWFARLAAIYRDNPRLMFYRH